MSALYDWVNGFGVPQVVASVGLALDIVGALLIFWYGLPAKLDRDGHQKLILGQIDEDEKAKAAKFDFRSKGGLLLLVVGFALQLVALWL